MNKKQLISMWCGVIAIVICLIFNLDHYYTQYYVPAYNIQILIEFLVGVFIISIITVALIQTFRDKNAGDK
jgi:hypothetical protein